MDVRPADILVMKKPHPCGSQTMYVIRAGMDFKLRCTGCGRSLWFLAIRSSGASSRSGGMPRNQKSDTDRKAGTQICWISFGKWKKTTTPCRRK